MRPTETSTLKGHKMEVVVPQAGAWKLKEEPEMYENPLVRLRDTSP